MEHDKILVHKGNHDKKESTGHKKLWHGVRFGWHKTLWHGMRFGLDKISRS